ncbi:MAG TPA: antitoxin [Micromonosporaceae bacterium]|nr:antitoxin [Micromonosporaceae bacterium]
MRFRRRRALTHAQLMRRELGEGMDHMRLAAVHAAGGMGAAVSPAMGRVRGAAADAAVAAVAPLATVARDGARQARKAQMKMMRKQTRTASRSRWPRLAGLLAAGAAVGAGVAYVRRRRQQQQWEEYDSGAGLTSVPSTTGSMVDSATDTTADALRTGGDKASAMAERAADKVERAGDKAADTADDMVSRSGTSSRNSRT